MSSGSTFELAGKRVFVAGHKGMVGSAIIRRLASEKVELLIVDHAKLDLQSPSSVLDWFRSNKPDAVFLAAAKVGGIMANSTLPVDFLQQNLAIGLAVIEAAHLTAVSKLLYLGSSCVYPKHASQPIREEELLSGPLEPTNEWYAIAKIAGIKLCQAYRQQHGRDFISVMPSNLYGAGDNYHPEHSHVPAALIRRMHESKLSRSAVVEVWGSGKPRREFLFVDDLADACVHLMKCYSSDMPINIGLGEDISIADFAHEVAGVVGFTGRVTFETSKPDGTPRKLLDTTRLLATGWRATTSLSDGLTIAYHDFLARTGGKL